jgi:hypothetical protein
MKALLPEAQRTKDGWSAGVRALVETLTTEDVDDARPAGLAKRRTTPSDDGIS